MTRLLGSLLNRLAFVCPGGYSVRPTLQRWRGVSMGKRVWLGLYVYIDDLHPAALSIGNNCSIGLRTSIFTHFYWGPRRPRSNGTVVIEDNVFVGPHCVILPNVRIGEGAVISAGTVVSRNVPSHTYWGVQPADALAEATVPLTADRAYADFLRGMKPLRKTTSAGPLGPREPQR
jgi:acetyltransferase-like isoleucine patch superfamily enzyme